jgi:hypothetical protein
LAARPEKGRRVLRVSGSVLGVVGIGVWLERRGTVGVSGRRGRAGLSAGPRVLLASGAVHDFCSRAGARGAESWRRRGRLGSGLGARWPGVRGRASGVLARRSLALGAWAVLLAGGGGQGEKGRRGRIEGGGS